MYPRYLEISPTPGILMFNIMPGLQYLILTAQDFGHSGITTFYNVMPVFMPMVKTLSLMIPFLKIAVGMALAHWFIPMENIYQKERPEYGATLIHFIRQPEHRRRHLEWVILSAWI